MAKPINPGAELLKIDKAVERLEKFWDGDRTEIMGDPPTDADLDRWANLSHEIGVTLTNRYQSRHLENLMAEDEARRA